jgi:nucleotide-binding universal stress UspA family protein
MRAHSAEVAATNPTARPPGVRASRRAWGLDRRTAASKRLRVVMQDIARQSGVPFDIGDALLRRAAELAVAAEVGRRALIRGEAGINVDHVLRLEGISARAMRDLCSRARAKPSDEPDLQSYLASVAAEEAAAAVSDAAGVKSRGDAETLTGEPTSEDVA